MTVKGGTNPSCAVCKFQRRKCKPDCILAPYFPANEPRTFQNVHRLFGVSNVMKLLKDLKTEEQREEAMKSIKYEADIRQRFPVYGCSGIICQLQQHLNQNIEELKNVYGQLAVFREQINVDDVQMQLVPDFGMQNQCFDELVLNDSSYLGKDLMGYGDNYYGISQDNYVVDTQAQAQPQPHDMMASNGGVDGDLDFDRFTDDDHKQSYIETKEAGKSRMDSFLQGSRGQACNNDLKNAAAYFGLTNTN